MNEALYVDMETRPVSEHRLPPGNDHVRKGRWASAAVVAHMLGVPVHVLYSAGSSGGLRIDLVRGHDGAIVPVVDVDQVALRVEQGLGPPESLRTALQGVEPGVATTRAVSRWKDQQVALWRDADPVGFRAVMRQFRRHRSGCSCWKGRYGYSYQTVRMPTAVAREIGALTRTLSGGLSVSFQAHRLALVGVSGWVPPLGAIGEHDHPVFGCHVRSCGSPDHVCWVMTNGTTVGPWWHADGTEISRCPAASDDPARTSPPASTACTASASSDASRRAVHRP